MTDTIAYRRATWALSKNRDEMLARRQRDSAVRAALDPHGLSETSLTMLVYLCEACGSVSMGALTEACGLSSGATTKVADSLEAHGYLTREHPVGDRRTVRAHATPDGRAALDPAIAAYVDALDGLT